MMVAYLMASAISWVMTAPSDMAALELERMISRVIRARGHRSRLLGRYSISRNQLFQWATP